MSSKHIEERDPSTSPKSSKDATKVTAQGPSQVCDKIADGFIASSRQVQAVREPQC